MTEELKSPVFSQPALPAPSRRVVPLRWIVLAVIVVVLAALVYVYRGVFVAALVNGMPISRYAVVRDLERQMGAQALDSLINRTLIEKKAVEAGIQVTPEDINQEIELIKSNLSTQGQTLEQALEAQRVSRESLEADIRFRKLAEKLVADRTVVSDDEVQKYMEENKQFLPPNTSGDEQKKNIRTMLQQQKFSTVFQEWLDAARKEADISYWKKY